VTIEMRGPASHDWPAVWPIWQAIVAAQETYMYDPFTPPEQANGSGSRTAGRDLARRRRRSARSWAPTTSSPTRPARARQSPTRGSWWHRPRAGGGIGRLMAEHCLARAASATTTRCSSTRRGDERGRDSAGGRASASRSFGNGSPGVPTPALRGAVDNNVMSPRASDRVKTRSTRVCRTTARPDATDERGDSPGTGPAHTPAIRAGWPVGPGGQEQQHREAR
jgi:hypothetical protein